MFTEAIKMSYNKNKQTSTNTSNKSTKYIIIFSIIIVIIGIIAFAVSNNKNKDTTTPTNSSSNAQETNQVIPDGTKGDSEATIAADISFREVDFSLTKDEIIEKEKGLNDTLDDPSIAESSDGYVYIMYKSNPAHPLSYNQISVSSSGNAGLTYVINNGNLTEVRLQFGSIDSAASNALIASIKTEYGDNTFYRSTNGSETYWWKSETALLMITKDSMGTSLFFRKN